MNSRRSFLASMMSLALVNPLAAAANRPASLILKTISRSQEKIPAVGMGSYLTFDASGDAALEQNCVAVLRKFFEYGGGMIDSSPMYASSEETIGFCLEQLQNTTGLFSATKVWTPGRQMGIWQMNESFRLWGQKRFDLLQVHNLLDWEDHLRTLQAWKEEGKVRYIGVTTSHGRRHSDLANLMETVPLDFVQLTYNMVDREVEQRLLPIALERGIAIIVNRPFQRNSIFSAVSNKPLPDWAAETGSQSWAQFFLKFIISHPAVTCVIPATSQVTHMQENMEAGRGILPDAAMRERMLQYFLS